MPPIHTPAIVEWELLVKNRPYPDGQFVPRNGLQTLSWRQSARHVPTALTGGPSPGHSGMEHRPITDRISTNHAHIHVHTHTLYIIMYTKHNT